MRLLYAEVLTTTQMDIDRIDGDQCRKHTMCGVVRTQMLRGDGGLRTAALIQRGKEAPLRAPGQLRSFERDDLNY